MALTVEEVLAYLNNYFVYTYAPNVYVDITAETKTIALADADYDFDDYALDLKVGQYVRIEGTRLNDGVYKVATINTTSFTVEEDLTDEESDEDLDYVTIWELAVPPKLESIIAEMITWEASSVAPSSVGHIQSEKLGPHTVTYAKNTSNNKPITVFDVFGGRIKRWKKVGW